MHDEYTPQQGLWIMRPMSTGHFTLSGYVDRTSKWPLTQRPDGVVGYRRCTYQVQFLGGNDYRVYYVHPYGPAVYFGEPLTFDMVLAPETVEDDAMRQRLQAKSYRGRYDTLQQRLLSMVQFVDGERYVLTQGDRVYRLERGDTIEPLSKEEYASGKITVSHYGGPDEAVD